MSDTTLKDKRGREWELFCDRSYYDLYCVRWAKDRLFNSHTSFHFEDREDALKFLRLLEKAS
jgi:hypothetical protein